MIFIFNTVFETLVEICVQYCLCGIICGHILKFLHQVVRTSNLSFSLCIQITYLCNVMVGVCLFGNHTKVILCFEAWHVKMLIKIEDNLFKKGYKGQYDLPLPLTFTRLNINSSTISNLTFDLQNESYPHFEIDLLPWYCIDYPKWGNVLLIKYLFIEHPQGVKMIVFSIQIKSYIFNN